MLTTGACAAFRQGGGGGGGSRSKISKNGGSGGLPPEIPRKFEKSSAQGGGGESGPPLTPPSLCTPLDNSMLTGFHLYNTAIKTAADEHAPSITQADVPHSKFQSCRYDYQS